MPVDVTVETEIAADPSTVAAIMFDPAREPEWRGAVETVDVVDPALRPGARVRRTGSFLGVSVAWTTEVETVHFPHLLVLRVTEGPMTGSVTYEIHRGGAGSIVRTRTEGETPMAPAEMLTFPVRAAIRMDLERLKALVEQGG